MASGVKDIAFSAGHFTVTYDSGPPKEFDISDVLRAVDVPDLTISSLTLLTTLANIVETLLKDLEDRGVVDESMYADWSLSDLLEQLKDDLSTDVGD